MLISIKFNDDYNCFFKNQKFSFKEINLLVGDQGSGKSTLLNLLNNNLKKEASDILIEQIDTGIKNYFYFDLEKDNPRSKQGDPFNSQSLLYSLTSKMKSHGEVLVPLLSYINEISNSYIFLDEPESSLSIRSQYNFIEILNEALKRNNQIFIATHNFIFMKAFPDNLISLEHLKSIKLNSFLNSQKEKSDFKDKRNDKIIKTTHCIKGLSCPCANETGWYNNRCENYIARGGLKRRK